MIDATLLLAQSIEPNRLLQALALLFVTVNIFALVFVLFSHHFTAPGREQVLSLPKIAGKFLIYESLSIGALIMLVPFYWMVVTAFKDGENAAKFPPVWTPKRNAITAPAPDGDRVRVIALETQRQRGQEILVVPEENYNFERVQQDEESWVMQEVPEEGSTFLVDPVFFETSTIFSLDFKNFMRAWYQPEKASRGRVNFLTYFIVSIISAGLATIGTLITSALAAFAFARLVFAGKHLFFYIILATMMVPGQVLLIPNFLILSGLGWLDTYAALIVPWLGSVFTIFLMRQFFMTIPEDLWDAARIDGASRFRYLWQVVVPLSKPVFITAGIFDFLNNWNSLLWPLIVTSSPNMRTLMVGLQNLSEDAGAEFHILMAASCFAILPIVIVFFFLQRFFIEGIARTGLK